MPRTRGTRANTRFLHVYIPEHPNQSDFLELNPESAPALRSYKRSQCGCNQALFLREDTLLTMTGYSAGRDPRHQIRLALYTLNHNDSGKAVLAERKHDDQDVFTFLTHPFPLRLRIQDQTF